MTLDFFSLIAYNIKAQSGGEVSGGNRLFDGCSASVPFIMMKGDSAYGIKKMRKTGIPMQQSFFELNAEIGGQI